MTEQKNTNLENKAVGEIMDDVMKQSQETLQRGARITAELNELKQRADDALDWRKQLRAHPWWGLGVAVGACVLLAALVSRKD